MDHNIIRGSDKLQTVIFQALIEWDLALESGDIIIIDGISTRSSFVAERIRQRFEVQLR